MADALTVIFTGLIIFDSGVVHFVKDEMHQVLVVIENASGTRTKEVRATISFEGLGSEPVGQAEGFKLPSLTSVFTGSPSVDPGAVQRLELHGGTIAPYLGYAVCVVDKKPNLFWGGVQWSLKVKPGAQLIIDGAKFDLDDNTILRISNNYIKESSGSHVAMYKKALKSTGANEHLPECAAYSAAPTPDPRAPLRFLNHNPVTCPPMALK